jgi:type I restriction enzyme, R subunit
VNEGARGTKPRLTSMDKQSLSERDICTKFITPALRKAGWDEMLQVREEVSFTKGRIIVRGKLVSRGQAKRADYILETPTVLTDEELDAVAAGHGDNNSGTTVQVGIASAQADDGSNAGLIVVGNQWA